MRCADLRCPYITHLNLRCVSEDDTKRFSLTVTIVSFNGIVRLEGMEPMQQLKTLNIAHNGIKMLQARNLMVP